MGQSINNADQHLLVFDKLLAFRSQEELYYFSGVTKMIST